MILGLDPGQNRGYCIVDETFEQPRAWGLRLGTIVWAGERLDNVAEQFPVNRIVCEYQYGARIFTGEIRAKDVIKLAFRAGFLLCEAMVTFGLSEAVAVTPQTWKPTLFRGGERIEKSVYTARLDKVLLTKERRLIPKNKKGVCSPDVLDGAGLAWSLPYLTDEQRALGRVTFDQILPKGKVK